MRKIIKHTQHIDSQIECPHCAAMFHVKHLRTGKQFLNALSLDKSLVYSCKNCNKPFYMTHTRDAEYINVIGIGKRAWLNNRYYITWHGNTLKELQYI